jgi:predicted  nucleic acid-binding Zn-ribbon protein
MRQIELLWKLQGIDSRIDQVEQELSKYTDKQKLKEIKSSFIQEKNLFEKSKELLGETVKLIRNSRSKAEELKYDYQQTEQKLYDGSVTNAKQLEGMQKNLEEMQKNIKALEDMCKAYEDDRKNLEEQIKRSKSKLIKYKNSFDALKKENTGGEEKARKELDELNSRRHQLVKEIEDWVMDRYNRVRLGTSNAVTLVQDLQCSGCHMELSVISKERLREDDILICETCGRILYYKQD